MDSSQLLDVSFAGSQVVVAGHTVKQFMDDANPVELSNLEVSQVGVNCNGMMIRHAKPAAAMLSITVIPSSADDAFFHDLLVKYHLQDGKNNSSTWERSLEASITLGKTNTAKRTYKFSGGTMVSGPSGASANGQGKMTGRTYTFAFAKIL